jgi:hypothetical protein
MLRKLDAAELSAFTLLVKVEQEVSWVHQDQGRYTSTCTISRRADGVAIACRTDALPDPMYRPPGVGGRPARDYDADGNLVVFMPRMNVAFCDADRNQRYFEWRSVSVGPEGEIATTGVTRILHRYPLTAVWSPPNEMRQIWWALGQGIASGLEGTLTNLSDPDGQLRLRARGTSNHGTLEGDWEVVLDHATGRVIRSASFQLDVLEISPSLQIETEGLRWFDSLPLPEEGVVRTRLGSSGQWLEKRVALLDFSHRADEELFQQVRRTLDDAGAGGELAVYDYRDNPATPTVAHERP